MRAPVIPLQFVLIAGGVLLASLGARDLIESHPGQTAAAREFTRTAAVAASPRLTAIRTGDTIARLSIPRLHTELYVMEGDDDAELRRGPGHLPGSAMPGSDGNVVIAGHRDTHFRVLKEIRDGDEIILKTGRGEFRYRVDGTSVVSPSDTSSLKSSTDPILHLVTCYPFYWVGAAPKRFVVEARLAESRTRVE